MLFKFYDNRNKNRLRKLLTRAIHAYNKTESLVEDTNGLIKSLETIHQKGYLSSDLKDQHNQLQVSEKEELEGAISART